MTRETQHPRTQLAWTRTGLSLAAVGLAEARLLVGPDPDRAVLVLAAVAALIVVLGAAAAVRLAHNADALVRARTRAGGRAPAVIAASSIVVGLLGLAAVATGPHL